MNKLTQIVGFFIPIALLFVNISFSQVGIGTTNFSSGALLDIESDSKGILAPRVALLSTLDNSTITPSATTGLLIFNTANSGIGSVAVIPGYYYWNGSQWVRIQSNDRIWSIAGNNNANSGTDFIGTTNNRRVDFRTNNTNRLRIPRNTQSLRAIARGTNSIPFYSFQENTNLGLWSPTVDQLALSADNKEFIRFTEDSQNTVLINNLGESIHTRIESQNNENMLFIDGTDNRVGIKTNTPGTLLHIAGDNNTARIDELNFTNNTHYTSSDPMPVYVNTNGDLILRPSLVQNFMALNSINFIPTSGASGGVIIGRDDGEAATTNIGALQSITLTQESVVHLNYQFSVRVSTNTPSGNPFPNDHGVITDGSPRQYSSWVQVNGAATKVAFDSDYYSNLTGSAGGAYAAGYFYLAGKGSIVLPAGTHTFQLVAHTYAGTGKSYRFVFADTPHERFQIIIQR
ncbi:MAG: hypothetical protein NXH73_08330 [Flavobacteriaceae bacterium]|nr:hypothetical protein [Flavobacteriaceae bacterium]